MTGEEVRERAAYLVGRRALSVKELFQKLLEKGATEEQATEATEWLLELGALNDAAYAEMVVRHYSVRGYGAGRIRQELSRRGVPKEYWEDALTELSEPCDTIDAFLERKAKGLPIADQKQKKKLHDALLRRGFSFGEVRDALRRYEHNHLKDIYE